MATQKGRNWSSGDIVAAANLSSIERGVSAVAEDYTPTSWANGDTVTAAALNNIEQGIAAAGGGGGGDLTTASVTFKNVGSGAYAVELCYLDNGIFAVGYGTVSGDTAVTVPCPFRISLESSFDNIDESVMPTVTGGVVLSFQDMAVYVNGDGTFTAAGAAGTL